MYTNMHCMFLKYPYRNYFLSVPDVPPLNHFLNRLLSPNKEVRTAYLIRQVYTEWTVSRLNGRNKKPRPSCRAEKAEPDSVLLYLFKRVQDTYFF